MKAFPVVGGPLDGEHATTEDFSSYHAYECSACSAKLKTYRDRAECPKCGAANREHTPGMYQHLHGEYLQYNNASGGRRSPNATMLWVHVDIAKRGGISPTQR